MEFLLSLLPLLILGGMLYLFLATLADAVKLPRTDKIAWVCLILLLFPFGSIIYILANPNKSKTALYKNNKRIIACIVVALAFLIIGTFSTFFQPIKNVPQNEVPLSQVIQQVNNGQIKRIEVHDNELLITKQGEDKPSEKSHKAPGSSLFQQGINPQKVEVFIK